MTSISKTTLALLGAFSLTGCIISIDGGWDPAHAYGYTPASERGPRRDGDGIAAEESRHLGRFDVVQVTGFFDVEVAVGSASEVILSGDSNLLQYVRTEVRDGSLELSMEPGRYDFEEPLRVQVLMPDLRALTISGSGDVSVGGVDREAVSFTITGSGDLEVEGRVDSATIVCSGSGEADLGELNARQVAVVVSGSSSVIVDATDRLDVSMSGSGRVRYIGKPQIAASISGSGDVEPR